MDSSKDVGIQSMDIDDGVVDKWAPKLVKLTWA